MSLSPTVFAPTVLALGLVLSAAASDAGAQSPAATVPVPPPLPPERPAALNPSSATTGGATLAPPRPTERTAPNLPAAEPGKPEIPVPPPTPPERPPELSGSAALALKVAPPDDTACRIRLKRLGVAFEPLQPIADGQCSAPLPLRVTALADGVKLPQGATLTCRMAEGLARWASEVEVEADRAFKQPLTGLELGGSYVCRGQNHDRDAKLSEHAFADAVDVTAFSLAGRATIPVKALPAGSPEADFLGTVRAKACGIFRTVLGPGTDAEHANHLHLDERERTAGHRLCE